MYELTFNNGDKKFVKANNCKVFSYGYLFHNDDNVVVIYIPRDDVKSVQWITAIDKLFME